MDYDTSPAKQTEAQEIRRVKEEPSKIFDEAYNLGKSSTTPWHGQPVTVGKIESMRIPAEWKEGQRSDNVQGNSSYREFSGDQSNSARVSFYDRGRRLTKSNAQAFRSLLDRPSGPVSRQDLSPVADTLLGPLVDSSKFALKSIQVTSINGEKVLEVDGTYLDELGPHKTDSKHIFVDANDDGQFVQEIELQSKDDKSPKLQSIFNKMLDSIKWK